MNETFDYLKFVPGFDFLKQMAQSGSGAPSATQWVAPTLEPEEIEKRIQELKTVQFWLEQNAKAVAATVQALEVQLMTLKALKGMNLSMEDFMKSMEIKSPGPSSQPDHPSPGAHPTPPPEKKSNPFTASFQAKSAREAAKTERPSGEAGDAAQHQAPNASSQGVASAQDAWLQMQERAVALWQEASNREHGAKAQSTPAQAHDSSGVAPSSVEAAPQEAQHSKSSSTGLAPDPMQWWGALTEQFSDIATKALNEIQRSGSAEHLGRGDSATPTTERSVFATQPKESSKAQVQKVKPSVKDKAKAKAKAATPVKAKKVAPVRGKATKKTLSSVLAKTIADSDANPIQNPARKRAASVRGN